MNHSDLKLHQIFDVQSVKSQIVGDRIVIQTIPVVYTTAINVGRASWVFKFCMVDDLPSIDNLGYTSLYTNEVFCELSHPMWIHTMYHEVFHVFHWQHNTFNSLADSEAAAELATDYAVFLTSHEFRQMMTHLDELRESILNLKFLKL